MGLLEDLLEVTSAVADTLDKGSQALRQGQEGLEYTKERLDWAKSDRPKKDRAYSKENGFYEKKIHFSVDIDYCQYRSSDAFPVGEVFYESRFQRR